MPVGGTDLSDNDAVDQHWVTNSRTPKAAVLGINGDSLEILALFLELSGWQRVIRSNAVGLNIDSFQLVFIDEDVFHSGRNSLFGDCREDLPIVLIGKSPTRRPTRILENRFPYLTAPLDVRAIETIIENL